MKRRVYNSIFWHVSSDFHNLKLCYEHVVGLMHRSSVERRQDEEQARAECKQRNIEFNERVWRSMDKIYDDVYPGFLHNAFLLSACALFEHQIKRTSAFVEQEHELPRGCRWDDVSGSVPTRAKTILGFAGVQLKDGPPWMSSGPLATFMPGQRTIVAKLLWNALGNYFMVRNCIAHHHGLVERTRNPDRVMDYATKNGILANKEGQPQLLLTGEFNKGVCENMQEFFWLLHGAYYATPLPE